MPQMSNMDWLFLSIYFMTIFLFCVILVYFLISLKLKNKVFKKNKKNFLFKWY